MGVLARLFRRRPEEPPAEPLPLQPTVRQKLAPLDPTPGSRPLAPPPPTAGTRTHRAPAGTPSTQRIHNPRRPGA